MRFVQTGSGFLPYFKVNRPAAQTLSRYGAHFKLKLFPDLKTISSRLSLNRKINYISIMKSLTINIPNTADIDDKEARMSLASKLYERGKLTLGQAAELAGYSKETFMELLADYNVSLINYPADELDEDIDNAQRYSI